jgi:AraC-like DNA-binding protein
MDWSASFHPESVEICLNLAGEGVVGASGREVAFAANTAGFYRTAAEPVPAARKGGARHQFVTAEFSISFLAERLGGLEDRLDPVIRSAMGGRLARSAVSAPVRLTPYWRETALALRKPPVPDRALPIWHESKALELLAAFAFQPAAEEELFCARQRRLAEDRVQRVMAALRENLAEPASLDELGRTTGCSPFYLSRIFSKHTGQTISQYLRQLRLERAAELLRGGKHNVTEAAFEVGYSSLSHFSQAFHEAFGCCPGLYPIGAGKTWFRPGGSARLKPSSTG